MVLLYFCAYPQRNEIMNSLPFKIEDLDPEITKRVSCDFSNGFSKLVAAGPDKMVMPGSFKKFAWEYYNFELKSDDVIVIGFPRSGTTLTQEIVWLLLNNLNYEKAKKIHFEERIPLFEGKSMLTDEMREAPNAMLKFKRLIKAVENLKGMNEKRRVFKTHLFLEFLPPDLFEKGCKIIYLARNPKDVAVSFYHLQKSISSRPFVGDFQTFFDYFKNDLIMFTPYWAHVKQGWNKRNHKNFKFLFYENLTKDLRKSVEEIAKFLDTDYNACQLDKLADNLRFDNFKNYINALDRNISDQGNCFVRRGKTGDWKVYFNEKLNGEANEWILENIRKIGITCPFEIE